MLIYLIRHGESEWNREGLFQGSSDPPLSQRGLLEARSIAQRFKNQSLEAIYSSGLIRAYETAKAIGYYHPLTIQRMKGLNERMMGVWEGLKRETIIERYRKTYRLWQEKREEALIPGGEPYEEFTDRVQRAFSTIMEREKSGKILIITHEGVIKSILCRIFLLPIQGVKFFRQGNTAVNPLEKKKEEFYLLGLNDRTHLDTDHIS